MLIEKVKIAKGMSYPLKSSHLESALNSAKITIDTHLIQGGSSHLFECFFWPPSQNVNYERLYIRTAPVSSNLTKEANHFIESTVIPEFMAWLAKLLALPLNSPIRQQQQRFTRELVHNT